VSREPLVLPLQNAEVTKQVSVARQAQVDLEREKEELESSFKRVSDQAQRKVSGRPSTGGGGYLSQVGLESLTDERTLSPAPLDGSESVFGGHIEGHSHQCMHGLGSKAIRDLSHMGSSAKSSQSQGSGEFEKGTRVHQDLQIEGHRCFVIRAQGRKTRCQRNETQSLGLRGICDPK
jgi:hypothetical protein